MPIEFHCTACNQLLRVPDDTAGRKAKCPGCDAVLEIPAAATRPTPAEPLPTESMLGPIIGGSASPEGDSPFQMPNVEDTYAGGAVLSVERSGLVTAVAVVNFVLGGLQVFFGGCITFFAILFGDAFRQAMDEAIKEGLEIEPEMVEAMGAIIVGMAIAMLAFGILSIAAGYGVSRRRPWGRILSLVLAGFTAFGVVLSLFDLDAESLSGIVIGLGYCALTFGVLCNPRYAAEFRKNV